MLNRTVLRAWVATALSLSLLGGGFAVLLDVAVSPTVAAADTSFSFTGGGFGHGVGLSQYGARGAARAGLNSTQILQYYYTGTTVGPAAEPNDLRVRVGTPASATVGSATNTGSGEITLLVDGSWIGTAARGTLITLTGSNGQVQAQIGGGPVVAGGYAAVEFNYSGSIIQVGPSGTRYDRGVLVATAAGSNVQININRLTMSEYLYGLAEMPSSWEVPALEAQAGAGRSYAINRRRGPGSSFDLEATTADQVYAGYDKAAGGSFDRWKAAVDTTAGRVVKAPDGSVANALYSSGHGGISEDNEYVFGGASSPGTPVSYLRSVNDPYEASSDNPYYRWTRTYTGSELGAWFGTGEVTAVQFAGPYGRSGRIDRANITLVSAGGNKTVRGDAFRRTINNNVPFDRELLSTLILNSPIGNLEAASATQGGVLVEGWAWDPSVTGVSDVDIYVDGTIAARGRTGGSRPDVGAAVAGAGNNRGFSFGVPAAPGNHRVCAYAIDDANLNNPVIGCKDVTVSNTPIGNFEEARGGEGVVAVSGWAIDRSRSGPVAIHVYVDGSYAGQGTADMTRTDVGAVHRGYGSDHGFSFSVPAGAGTHEVCAFIIDDTGPNPNIGCRRATSSGAPAPPPSGNGNAIGNLEDVRRPDPANPFLIQVSGWALDLDTAEPINVHVYLDDPYPKGTGVGAVLAADPRTDVGKAYPGKGDAHGFTASVPYKAGRRRVCAHAINQAGGGTSTVIGCATPPNVAPIGNLELVQRTSANEVRIAGWALDPDSLGSLKVHVYVGGPVGGGGTGAGAFTADVARDDVGSAYPGFGAGHGFDFRIPVPSATTPIYVYLIDDGNGRNPLLGSKNV